MSQFLEKYRIAIVYCGLIAAVWAVFGRTCTFDFLALDDNEYVTANAYVQAPFAFESLRWAFTTGHFWNWHPLTWLSHMLDCFVFGMDGRGHHFTNVLLHTINTLLLFEIFRRLERIPQRDLPWKSMAVAGLFAIHPLHVQSVAWIAERKDLLSTCFEFGAVLAYLGYAARPGAGRYLLALALFAFALMAKSMAAPLPGLLLLLDYWPLRRYTGATNRTLPGMMAGEGGGPAFADSASGAPRYSWTRLVIEKIPFGVLSAAACLIALGLKTPQSVPFVLRLLYVPVAYIGYIGKTVWPSKLAVFYPHPGASLPLWQSGICAALLALAALAAFAVRRRKPYLFLGWFWYGGMLLPASGIVQISMQGMADHYTYVPLAGIFIMGVWGFADLRSALSRRSREKARQAISLAAGAAVAALGVVSYIQVGYWRDSVALFTRAVEAVRDNERMHVALAHELQAGNDLEGAVRHLREAVRIDPARPRVWNNLGVLLERLGRSGEAAPCYETAVRLDPQYATAHANLAQIGAARGDYPAAARHYQAAVEADPAYTKARMGLVKTLVLLGRTGEARHYLLKALELDPSDQTARHLLEELGPKPRNPRIGPGNLGQ